MKLSSLALALDSDSSWLSWEFFTSKSCSFVVRPFRVVLHEAKASHYILKHPQNLKCDALAERVCPFLKRNRQLLVVFGILRQRYAFHSSVDCLAECFAARDRPLGMGMDTSAGADDDVIAQGCHH